MSPLQLLHTRKGNMDSLQFEKKFWNLQHMHSFPGQPAKSCFIFGTLSN